MRPLLVAWLTAHGLPGWIAPDYLAMGGVGALLGGWFVLRHAPAERRRDYALAMAAGYVASYVVGHLFELIRLAPGRLWAGDYDHLLEVGRAAYGGLFGSLGAAAFVLYRRRLPLGPFFELTAVSVGLVFGCVRVGCFLAGCDYGTVTASAAGVRFPAGSLAALDHASRGLITAGYPSLPVHPTQLYEAAFGMLSAAVVYGLFRARIWRRRLLFVWLTSYACFRFGNELLRGDGDRGAYAGLSTAQVVSLTFLAVAAVLYWRGDRSDRSRPSAV